MENTQQAFSPSQSHSSGVSSNAAAQMSDVRTLRERARRHIEGGAVTEGYGANRDAVLKLLNEALATELVCALRYKRHYYMPQGPQAEAAKAEFLEHAKQEE